MEQPWRTASDGTIVRVSIGGPDTAPGDPNDWTVVVTGRPVAPTPQRHPRSLTGYLAGLADGSIEPPA